METQVLKSKLLYKIFLVALKYIPILVTLSYIANTVLCWFGIDVPVLSNISGMSLLTWLFMYIATYVLMSKYQACQYLNVSRATFDNYVREGNLPRGKKEAGFKELFWTQKDLDEFKKKSRC